MSLEALSYRGTETLDKIQGTEQGILLGSSISLDFKNTRVAIGHLGNVISQGKVTVSSLIDANSNTWQTSKIITEPSATNGSYFGHTVSMNWTGTRIAVGAYGVDKVYVFDATSTSSNPWATYVSNTISGYTNSNFGYSVSLGQDIDTALAIGAPNHNRVDVWKLSNSSWSLAYSNIGDDIPNVIPLNSTSGTVTIDSKLSSNVSSLQYGFSCKLAPFGTHLIIGAPGTPLDAISSANSNYSGSNTSFLRSDFPHAQRQSGSVRVLVTTDDWASTVSQIGQTFSGLEYDGSNHITNNGNLFFPTLGYSVAINFDGSVIAMSAPNRVGGTVRVYEYSTVSNLWEPRGVDITSGSGLKTGFDIGLDYTGNRVAMSMVSNWAFPAVLNAQLYVLDWSGSDWIEAQLPISSKDPGVGYEHSYGAKEFSGYRLDITDGNQVAVSRLWWDDDDFQGDDYYTGSGGSVSLSTAMTTFPANQNSYGRVDFYFFLITATFTGNSIFEGYITARELRIGPNDDATDNTIPKRISFGGTVGDNYYDETIIENRIVTGSAGELLIHKDHQTNETIDRVRIKASEIHLDHMRMYHSVYQGGQESKNVQSPRFILDQFGTIAIGNLYSGNDSTSLTTSLAETYLDIKAETQIRDKLNVNYPGRTKLLKSRDYTYQGYSPAMINTRCADLIGTNIMYDDQPGEVKEYSITNQGNMPYIESEKAFEFTGTDSGIGYSSLPGVWTDDDASMMFWLKLKDDHSNYTSSNVLCSWGDTLSSTVGVYTGGCLQLTSTGLTLNFGSGIGTASNTYTFTQDTWYHICVVFPTETTTASGKDYIYINNQNMTLTKTYSTNPYVTFSQPNWDSQGWRFGYGEASGSIPGPAGTFMGMMIFNISWGHGGSHIKDYSYNNGSPSECLCVGGDAHIQNKLGVGTLSPSYELDVTGDINLTGDLRINGNVQALSSVWSSSTSSTNYPLSAMSSLSSGGYTASVSSRADVVYDAWYAFNNVIGLEGWLGAGQDYNASPNGGYTGSVSTTYDVNKTASGEWIQLQVPTSITIGSIKIAPVNGNSLYCAGDGIILGSTNGSTWTKIHSFTGQTYTDGQYTTIFFSNSVAYSYFRLVVERTASNSTLYTRINIGELKFCVSTTYVYNNNNGNIGIGTASPGYKLDVNGDINMSTGSSFRINGVAQSFGGGGGGGSFSGDIADYITHTGDTNTYFGFPSDDTFIIKTNGTERLRANSSGNIGIGTTSPSYNLDVTGTINATNAIYANGVSGQSGQVLTSSGGGPNFWSAQSGSSPWTSSGSNIYRGSGQVNIGGSTFTRAKLEVNGSYGSYLSFTYYAQNTHGGNSNGVNTYSIYANQRIAANEFNAHSDIRIKKNIIDINDSSALDKIRLLEPKIYNYIDDLERGTSNVYGFIAQEVANVLPYAVTVSEGDIPNILRNSNVSVTSDSNVLELRLDTTVEGLTLSNTSVINIITDKDKDLKCNVLSFSESNVITIENTGDFSNVTNAFIKGEQISDFHHLNKDAIWAVSTAALQEVDRQLQTEKAKVSTLETQVANLLARVTALENN